MERAHRGPAAMGAVVRGGGGRQPLVQLWVSAVGVAMDAGMMEGRVGQAPPWRGRCGAVGQVGQTQLRWGSPRPQPGRASWARKAPIVVSQAEGVLGKEEDLFSGPSVCYNTSDPT